MCAGGILSGVSLEGLPLEGITKLDRNGDLDHPFVLKHHQVQGSNITLNLLGFLLLLSLLLERKAVTQVTKEGLQHSVHMCTHM